MPTGTVVLGMHRSGTSAVTQAIHALGACAGDRFDMDLFQESNANGHWESVLLRRVNDELLHRLGGRWDAPPELGFGWWSLPAANGLVGRARAAFAAAYGSATPWVWKDPRNCLTLPFWLRALDVSPLLIVVWREPAEVAGSLAARDDLPRPVGLALWEEYTAQALRAARNHRVYVLSFSELLDDPEAACAGLSGAMRDAGIDVADAKEGAATIDRRLRHHGHDGCLRGHLSGAQRSLVDVLEGSAGYHEIYQPGDLADRGDATRAVLRAQRASLPARDPWGPFGVLGVVPPRVEKRLRRWRISAAGRMPAARSGAGGKRECR